MKKNIMSDEDKIQYEKMMSLYEWESTRQNGDEKFRKMINRYPGKHSTGTGIFGG